MVRTGAPLELRAESAWPVRVEPGDVVMADGEGVVCFPAALLPGVLAAAGRATAADALIAADVAAGMPLTDAIARHRG